MNRMLLKHAELNKNASRSKCQCSIDAEEGIGKWELRQTTKQALQLLHDNYPEFVAKQVFISVPWWYMDVNKMIIPFLTQRTKCKFVFVGPSKSVDRGTIQGCISYFHTSLGIKDFDLK